jgi:mono/diheme cytochrome c family protein
MNCRAVVLIAAVAAWACNGAPGRPGADSAVIPPNRVLDFDVLYASNCAGCHGANGAGGLASSLADPLYLAIADDATIRRVTTEGVAGTAMPAFARSGGGLLTAEQVDVIVKGIRARWAKPAMFLDVELPSYAAQAPGDAQRGANAYAVFCASCHGPAGRGGQHAGSIVDRAYLTMVSDQSLRTTVIAGRPDLGAPDWRSNVPGKPMSPQDISDVVAWLAAQRPAAMLAAGGFK